MEKVLRELKSFVKTLLCFMVACFLVPLLLLSFIFVHYSSELMNYVLTIKYPTLTISKSKKIRTLIDTPHNAGIFSFLIQVNGTFNLEKIRQIYAERLTDARDKTGYLKFPKLRQRLVSCWGRYAWVNDTSDFNINNQVLLGAQLYRGRPVTEANIQDYISDLVMKYIPSDLPQWQVVLIPVSAATTAGTMAAISATTETSTDPLEQEHYYVLVKVHHLIIAEEEDLHISELLMLQDEDNKHVISLNTPTTNRTQTLSYFVRTPVHIQLLLQHIGAYIVNRWNAFIYDFESLETPDGYRSVQIVNISQLLSVLLIIMVNVCIDCWRLLCAKRRQRHCSANDSSTSMLLRRLLSKELMKRNLNWQIAYAAIAHSCQPSTIVTNWSKFLWQLNVNHCLLLPYHAYCELMACRDLIFKGHTKLMSTYSGRLAVYLPMLIYAQLELFKICYEIYKAPVNIYEELFETPSSEANILHKKSYSGRKIVSYSKSIDSLQLRKRITFTNEVRESDFALSCLAGAIHDYLELDEQTVPVPKCINTTCRTMGKGYFTDSFADKMDHIGGIVLLQLPLKTPDQEHARQMHQIVEEIRHKQIMIYLASMGQTKYDIITSLLPRVLSKVFINMFSFNFPITITEIHGATAQFQTIWGQQVQDVLLFRPPQSKTCLSLNMHRFGDKYRLAVMADTQLGPDHAKIVRSFEKYMETATL